MNAIFYDIRTGTIDIYLSEPKHGCEYLILDSRHKIVHSGCLHGRVQKTCLFVGELNPGDYFFEVNGVQIEFKVIASAVLMR
jgi:hypothetical protein